MVGQFNTAGADLMLGLSAGINAAAGQVAAAAANAATVGLQRRSHRFQGPQPSLLFAQLGYDWGLGLVQGLASARGVIQNAANTVIPHTIGHPGAVGMSGSGGVSLSMTVNYTINAPGGNPGAIKSAIGGSAEQLQKAMLTSLRAGAGTIYP